MGGAGADSHVCLRCGGELRFGVAPTKRPKDRVAINVGYVSLMPGAWGRLADKSGELLPVLKSGADLLRRMGVTTMRSGGSVSQSMRWKDWRGPQWNRPSVGQIWGKSFLAGWGAPDSLCYHAFGLIVTALSKKIGVSQPSSLKVVPISPNALYAGRACLLARIVPRFRRPV